MLAACAGSSGALENTNVTSECQPTDFACVTAGLNGPVAVGGVLPLSLGSTSPGNGAASTSLMSADPAVLKAAGTEVVGMAPGVAALVMLAEGSAVDFLHVFVAAPTRLGLHRVEDGFAQEELTDRVELLVGDELVLAAEPYRDSQRLLGHSTSTWSAGNPVAILRDGSASRRRIVARTPGEVSLVVSEFGFEKTLVIEVLP